MDMGDDKNLPLNLGLGIRVMLKAPRTPSVPHAE